MKLTSTSPMMHSTIPNPLTGLRRSLNAARLTGTSTIATAVADTIPAVLIAHPAR